MCPVGAFLGLASKFSIFKLKFDTDKCISCGLCEKVCKTESINYKNMQIDFDRCVSCFNCLDVCTQNAISYRIQAKTCVLIRPKLLYGSKIINIIPEPAIIERIDNDKTRYFNQGKEFL